MELQQVKPEISLVKSDTDYAQFRIEPLRRGYGHTVGNSLRRVLLSSLPGAAVTTVRIVGVLHEFSTVPGVKEDVTQIILNIKKLRVRCYATHPVELYLEVQREGPVTAADIQCPPEVTIVNPNLLIATLDSPESRLEMQMTVERGIGFDLAENRHEESIGVIPVDAIFTPIRRVEYRVESARVGQETNWDALILSIWTDGTITPAAAFSQSGQILTDYFSLISNFHPVEEPVRVSLAPEQPTNATSLDKLNLSTGAYNALLRNGVNTVEQLMALDERSLAKFRGMGEKRLKEVKEVLAKLGLSLAPSTGQDIPEEQEAEEVQA